MTETPQPHPTPMMELPLRCPCCGSRSLASRGGYDICPVCFWEDDGQDDDDADVVLGGPNGDLSLTDARANYRRFGASRMQDLRHVRQPLPQELPGLIVGNTPAGAAQRYLSAFDTRSYPAAGRTIEQLLPGRYEAGQQVIRYLSIERDNASAWTVRLCEVFDNGAPDFLDLVEFEAVDPDLPFGQEWLFDTADSALHFAETQMGALVGRYMNVGMAQDAYRDLYHPEW
ncbi:TPA: hypothetical protein QDZ42_002087 [Stenotrophomonas maltophilia]|nr:hypothetical protein [Stenotrophomonas maltophilia]HDS1043432.1 hypothetical protein [Stenotrophomonas maltophilia]